MVIYVLCSVENIRSYSHSSGMTIPFALALSSYFFLYLPSGSNLVVISLQISISFLIRCSITVYAPFSWVSVHFSQPVSMASWRCSNERKKNDFSTFYFAFCLSIVCWINTIFSSICICMCDMICLIVICFMLWNSEPLSSRCWEYLILFSTVPLIVLLCQPLLTIFFKN